MTQPEKRRHHTVPAFYLKRFANERPARRPQVMRVPLSGRNRHLMSVNDASVETDFYLMEVEDGSWTDEAEDALSNLETDAAQALRVLVDEAPWPIPPEVREPIAAWAAVQYLRSPAMRQALNTIADTAFKSMIERGGRLLIEQVLRDKYGRTPTEAEVGALQAATQFDGYHLKQHQNEHMLIMHEMLPGTTAMFYHRGWSVIRFAEAITTSDAPVVLLPDPNADQRTSLGLASAPYVLVPLDRHVVLVMGAVGDQDYPLSGNPQLAYKVNRDIVRNAYQCLFHHPDDAPLTGIDLTESGD